MFFHPDHPTKPRAPFIPRSLRDEWETRNFNLPKVFNISLPKNLRAPFFRIFSSERAGKQ